MKYKYTVKDRFLKYVKFNTQSDSSSESYPSTPAQLELLNELLKELLNIGLKDAFINNYGYVVATIPSNTKKSVPVIGFIAHVDTSDSVSSEYVNPIVHRYKSGNITLPGDNSQIIYEEELTSAIGKEIITSDGKTLLGADDKAGVAEIVDAAQYLIENPDIKHGEIKIAFTPDEEIGLGVKYFDVEAFGADYAYTLDGGEVGDFEIETFNAKKAIIKFYGNSTHPGTAKGKMVNSIKIASEFISSLPKNTLTPETTEGREGFIHCTSIRGIEEETILEFIIREFEEENISKHENLINSLAKEATEKFRCAKYEVIFSEQYKNMKNIIDKHPKLVEITLKAFKKLDIKPKIQPIRGGTDGAQLSFKGLPTPNLFSGQHNIHSKREWIAVEDMQLTVDTIIEICKTWEENSK